MPPRCPARVPSPRSRPFGPLVSRPRPSVQTTLEGVSAQAQPTTSLERDWWLRLGMVFIAPRTVFAWLRDDSDDAVGARQEPVLLVGFLAGGAGVLASSGIS